MLRITDSPHAMQDEAIPADPREPPHPVIELPSDPEWERLALYQGLENTIRRYGARRVMTIVRSLALILGEDV